MIDKFVDYLQYNKNYSLQTIKSYKGDLVSFQDYLKSVYDVGIDKADKNIIRSYIANLSEQGLVAKSINRKLSTLKSFYKYLQKENLIDENPVSSISNLKIPKRLPKYVEESRIEKLLEFNDLGLRERLVILLLYNTGIRRSELINLEIKNIDFIRQELKILGKGNKERVVPFSKELKDLIKEYIDSRNDESESLIVTDKGKKTYPKFIYNIINTQLAINNISEQRSPHVLRHTYATHLLNNGADLNTVKDLLGHSSLAATQVYTHNSLNRIKKVYEKFHPKK